MLLSDLLHTEVVDADGRTIGSVHDVHLVQDGPLLLPFGAAYRVEGLLVGRGSLGTRLGYHRGGGQGPWLLKSLFGALERRAHFVAWEDVESYDSDVIRLRRRRDELGPPPLG